MTWQGDIAFTYFLYPRKGLFVTNRRVGDRWSRCKSRYSEFKIRQRLGAVLQERISFNSGVDDLFLNGLKKDLVKARVKDGPVTLSEREGEGGPSSFVEEVGNKTTHKMVSCFEYTNIKHAYDMWRRQMWIPMYWYIVLQFEGDDREKENNDI